MPSAEYSQVLGNSYGNMQVAGLEHLGWPADRSVSPKEQTPQTEVSLTPSHGMYVILTAAGVHGGCCLQTDGTVQVRQV